MRPTWLRVAVLRSPRRPLRPGALVRDILSERDRWYIMQPHRLAEMGNGGPVLILGGKGFSGPCGSA